MARSSALSYAKKGRKVGTAMSQVISKGTQPVQTEEVAIAESEDDAEDDREEEDESEDDDENSENGGVTQGGMERLLRALDSENEEGNENILDADPDVVPIQKSAPILDNEVALSRILSTIALPSSLPWTETLAVTHTSTIEGSVSPEDDLSREVAFYEQALASVKTARSLASKHNLPWTRPNDYFAEQVKSDAHMERIRQRLLNEGATIKRGEEKRREREGKKFGKAVQVATLQDRQRKKKEVEKAISGLKRKRGDVLDDDFDVQVEDALEPKKPRTAGGGRSDAKKPHISRDGRNKKFGFGGQGRRDKSNTRQSTDDFSGHGGKGAPKGKAQKPKRLGKSRRNNSRR